MSSIGSMTGGGVRLLGTAIILSLSGVWIYSAGAKILSLLPFLAGSAA
jgi:hypothetical protein